MRFHKTTILALLLGVLLTSCLSPETPQSTPLLPPTDTAPQLGQPLPTARPARTATQPSPLSPGATRFTILYTSDEHGWMSGQENGQGAAELFGLWQAQYGLGHDPAVLALSGGDNWTGPAISTW